MDKLDRKILNIVQQDGRVSIKSIAEKCFISAPSASVRLQNLENHGFITGYTATVNYEKLGYLIKAFVRIDVSYKELPKFVKFISKVPNVVECNFITGDASVQLKVFYKTMIELNRFNASLKEFGNTHTNVAFTTNIGPRPLQLPEKKSD
ncbi:Lrp/AsnC family transcriptional regulator [Lentilactobacillus hilgardii]|uniref:Lrp/AsnC family transcriptional regulator n=1 Tax=Lentilactobacillus hilgardii TaxID=1588 RepID=UPI00019C4C36|nr:Lrp/AsnC family transcriptional regulator [Lentilactobacillus hilgardii]EEI20553.1 transcriptional regulator, AsnC family [Lentilactobacillus buchneri ATCC 11577]MCP9334033.1 Lrp/AsnC family transcriptional regulator [Lentilactobacillus hilgardii]MCP9348990.1 Lrp/AsnC family transcriptional regulator [Lentilactobacillus hilgardii]MCP9351918.1 Lrp/AsnC family transcriptional regulator [Lentilactobacillus hilgardii]MCT3396385.1 Lrp/AsnC family transcriptional regulator [Lentilactobacillus hil